MSLPFSLGWGAAEGGVVDKDGLGTGFTMIQPSTSGGYLPANLDLNTAAPGTLDITTTSGISSRPPTTTTGASNGQHNALGVAFNGTAGPVRLETTLVNPPAGNNQAEQAGVWFGINEDNYVKVVVASVSTTQMRVQLAREIAGVSNGTAAGDEVNTGNLTLSASTVRLSLVLNPAANTATATYRIDGAAPVSVGAAITVPASFFTGIALETGGTPKTFAGIFATHRNRTATPASLVFRFGEFLLTNDLTAPAAPTGLTATAASATSVDLDWADNGEADLAGYDVYRAANPEGPYTKITASPISASSYTDTGLTSGTLYAYQVRALDGSGNVSAASAAATALPRCGQPAGGDLPGPGQLPVSRPRRSRPATPATSARTTPTSGASAGSCPARPPRAAWSATAATGRRQTRRPAPRHVHAHAGQQRHQLRQRRPARRLGDRRPQRDLQRRGQRRRAQRQCADPTSHDLNVEGLNVINAFVPSGVAGSATRHTSGSRTVTVSDGRLTIDPIGGTNTKINYVVITPAAPPDTTPPDAPVITTPAADGYDLDGDLTLAGTAEAGSTVELFDGATSKGTTTATAGGTWSIALTDVADGVHVYTAKATDAAPNTSDRVGRPDDHRRHRRPDRDRPQPAGRPRPAWPLDVTVTAELSEALDPATVTGTSVTLDGAWHDRRPGDRQLQRRDRHDQPEPGRRPRHRHDLHGQPRRDHHRPRRPDPRGHLVGLHHAQPDRHDPARRADLSSWMRPVTPGRRTPTA